MVASPRVPAAAFVAAMALLFACCFPPFALGGELRYYEDFDPQRVPWLPSEEKNIEEVFKNYRYFAIEQQDDLYSVSEYQAGKLRSVRRYRLDGSGRLQPQSEQQPVAQPADLYAQHCVSCHATDRLGATGPALLPQNLERLRRDDAIAVIRSGRPATQMPGFAGVLDDGAIRALVDWIYAPAENLPDWNAERISASHQLLHAPGSLPDKPVFAADPLNLFMVVEAGDHHVTVLDGDRFEPVFRFATHYALHGGVKFSPDGRYAYLASRDGWISKFDIYNLVTVAEIRAGINTRNVAVSADGATLMVANYLPETLVALDATDLSLLKVIPVADSVGKASRVSAVYQAAPRQSFIAALKDVPELWEISDRPPEFPVRRVRLERPLDDFFFDQDYRLVIGADRAQQGGQVVELDSGRQVAQLPLQGMPHLGSGITWEYQGRPVFATPDLGKGGITVVDMQDWKVIRQLPMPGPGFFLRSHENTPYAWADVFSGPQRDVIEVLDKRTLEPVKALRPASGKTSAHVEFTRDGRFALVSIWEMDGALVVYDAASFEEIKRIPMCKPSGKYNVYNKITRSAGTSH